MPTEHAKLLRLINALAEKEDMRFEEKGGLILTYATALEDAALQKLLGQSGFIPEQYEHDSSEEKLYAKAMDCLVAAGMQRAGYDCIVVRERSNRADVEATCGVPSAYRVVLDAKALRLSRTALNPKDYKIEALNSWRSGAEYACLVAPIVGFPLGESRLYEEAVRFNVTLLSFSHLEYMVEHRPCDTEALKRVWSIAAKVKADVGETPNAVAYWKTLDTEFCVVMGIELPVWKRARQDYHSEMLSAFDEQIRYYEEEKAKLAALSREELFKLVVSAMKIDERIGYMRQKKQRTIALLRVLDASED